MIKVILKLQSTRELNKLGKVNDYNHSQADLLLRI